MNNTSIPLLSPSPSRSRSPSLYLITARTELLLLQAGRVEDPTGETPEPQHAAARRLCDLISQVIDDGDETAKAKLRAARRVVAVFDCYDDLLAGPWAEWGEQIIEAGGAVVLLNRKPGMIAARQWTRVGLLYCTSLFGELYSFMLCLGIL